MKADPYILDQSKKLQDRTKKNSCANKRVNKVDNYNEVQHIAAKNYRAMLAHTQQTIRDEFVYIKKYIL